MYVGPEKVLELRDADMGEGIIWNLDEKAQLAWWEELYLGWEETLLFLKCALTQYVGLKMKKVADSILTWFVGIKGQHDALEGKVWGKLHWEFYLLETSHFQSWF